MSEHAVNLTAREVEIIRSSLGDYYAMRARFSPKGYDREVSDLRNKIDRVIDTRLSR